MIIRGMGSVSLAILTGLAVGAGAGRTHPPAAGVPVGPGTPGAGSTVRHGPGATGPGDPGTGSLTAATAPPVEVFRPERLRGTAVAVRLGEEIIIHLDEQAGSTGHSWSAVIIPHTLAPVGDEVSSPPARPGVLSGVGMSGEHRFTFRGVRPGTARLGFALRRPWEPVPLRTLTITVTVRADAG